MQLSRFAMLVLLAFLTACKAKHLSKKSIDALIRSNLSLGATVPEVSAFLDSQQIKHSEYAEGLEPMFAPSSASPSPTFSRYVLARIPEVKEDVLTTFDVYIIFCFDENGRMTEYKLKEVGTGP